YFPASIFVVVHIAHDAKSHLPEILSRHGPLPATHPENGTRIRPGHIYVAPPGSHLLVMPGTMCLLHGPKENGFRPAIDPLCRSAAHAYGRRVIGVVLSGSLDDGTAGLQTIKTVGGLAVVQDPEECLYSAMATSAIAHVAVDYVLPIAEIGSQLT